MRFLNDFYGNGTRSVQTLNLSLVSLWIILLVGHVTKTLTINIPLGIKNHITFVVGLALATQLLAVIGFLSKGYRHQLFKTVALLFGALHQCIVAVCFTFQYPPFDLTVIFSTVFSLWFLGAALYIVKVEGFGDTDL